MNPRERFLAGCSNKEIEELSVAPFLKATACEIGGVSIKSYCENADSMATAQLKCAKAFDVDSVNIACDVLIEAETMGSISVRPEKEFPRLRTPALDSMTVDDIPIPDVTQDGRFPVKIKAVNMLAEKEYAVISWVMSAYQLATQLRGFSKMIVDLMRHDRKVKPLLDKCLKVSKKYAEVLIEEGSDVIAIGNASSSQDVISPKTYLDNLAGYDKQLSDSIRKKGALSQMHICGNTTPILGTLDTMVDIVDVDHKVDIDDATTQIRRATIKGNVNPSVLRFGTIKQVKDRTEEIISTLKRNSRTHSFIFSTGCEVPIHTPHETIKTMVDLARKKWKTR